MRRYGIDASNLSPAKAHYHSHWRSSDSQWIMLSLLLRLSYVVNSTSQWRIEGRGGGRGVQNRGDEKNVMNLA